MTTTPERAKTVAELIDSLEASLGDWLVIDGEYYTVVEFKQAIERKLAAAKAYFAKS